MQRTVLNKKNRLKTNSSFKATYCQNRVVSDEFFVLFAGKNKPESDYEPKIGFVVSKKTDKRAVVRNKIKRRMRESFKIYLKEKEIPYMSLILTAKESAKNINFEITLKSVYKLMDKMANKFIQEYY